MTGRQDGRGGRAMHSTKHLSPRQGARYRKTRLRETVRLFERSPFPLFGLPPSWAGERWFAGSSGGGHSPTDTIEALLLGHRPLLTESARLVVKSEAPGLAQGRDELQCIAEIRWHGGVARIEEAVERYRADWRVPEDKDVEMPVESEADIKVDGSPVRFRILRRTDSWLAFTKLSDVWITTESSGGFEVDGVELATVRDLQPYIEGTRAVLGPQRQRPPDPPG
jgi:hypothetical protein